MAETEERASCFSMENQLTAPFDKLKEREIEILNLMADGLSNQEIAETLFITKETVRWYNKQIYSKLGTSRRIEAVALAKKLGLIGNEQPTTDSVHIQHKLPSPVGPFIGRDAEIDELQNLLQKPEIRLMSIIGVGGMGKSRISLELAHLIKENYETGAVFIDLLPVRNPDNIAKVAVESLGFIRRRQHKTRKRSCLITAVKKRLLLLFDNYEHVLAGATLLTELLKAAPRIQIITTSRERLGLRAETAYYPPTSDGECR